MKKRIDFVADLVNIDGNEHPTVFKDNGCGFAVVVDTEGKPRGIPINESGLAFLEAAVEAMRTLLADKEPQ